MDHPGRPRGGRLPDPGMGAICGRCGEPRLAHGGPRHLGACPGESGIEAKRFSIASDDRPQPEFEEATPSDRLPLPPRAVTAVDELVAFVRQQLDRQEAALIAYRDHRAGLTPCDNLGDYDSCSVHLKTAAATEYRDVDYGLTEVEAKRRILDLHHPIDPCDAHDPSYLTTPCDTMLALVQPFAGRDGWREEWAT